MVIARLFSGVLLSSAISLCTHASQRGYCFGRGHAEASNMRKADAKILGALPSATGQIARLAYTQAKNAGIEVGPLLQQAGITPHQIEHTDERLKVRDQIQFLNLTADALQDESLGFHLAQLPDLRELGLIYYVSASSGTLSEALRRVSRYSRIVN